MAKPNPKTKITGEKLLRVSVKRVSNAAELTRAYSIRIRVFVKEQGVPREIELDDDDPRAMHFLAVDGRRAIGTARVVLHHGAAKIGRMAVLKSYRRRGVGAKLLKRAIAAACRMKARKIYLHAQIAVSGFYQRLNFHSVGPVFDEAGIAHRKMIWRRRKIAGKRRTNRRSRYTSRSKKLS
jgi:predicted GNAT family N-acyltransferase